VREGERAGGSARDWSRILARIRAGDRVAFLETARLITGLLAEGRAYDFRDEWDDGVQAVVLAGLEARSAQRLRAPGAALAYLRSAARVELVGWLSRRRPARSPERGAGAEILAWPPAEWPSPEGLRIWDRVRRLPRDVERALMLVYVEDLTDEEAADRGGVPLESIRRDLRDGLAMLREALADFWTPEAPDCEVDLAAYLAAPTGDEWASFRLHFPFCPHCSAAVAAWTELEVALRSGAAGRVGSAHPQPARLVAFDAEPAVRAADRGRETADHLRSCRRCADELAALRAFDFGALPASPLPPPSQALRALFRALGERLAGSGRSRGGRGDATRPEHAARPAPPHDAPRGVRPVAVLVALGRHAGKAFPLFPGTVRIGRARECEIRIEDADSRVAATLRIEGNERALEARARRALQVNGRPAARATLSDGDRLELAGVALEFRLLGG
jgi:DNA-directed RNA polymerase specialized sigma24 family protein